jgi:hypothetical protein
MECAVCGDAVERDYVHCTHKQHAICAACVPGFLRGTRGVSAAPPFAYSVACKRVCADADRCAFTSTCFVADGTPETRALFCELFYDAVTQARDVPVQRTRPVLPAFLARWQQPCASPELDAAWLLAFVDEHRLGERVADALHVRCPACDWAFDDFEGCDAVTCARDACRATFCGACFAPCGVDAHAHVVEHHNDGEYYVRNDAEKRRRFDARACAQLAHMLETDMAHVLLAWMALASSDASETHSAALARMGLRMAHSDGTDAARVRAVVPAVLARLVGASHITETRARVALVPLLRAHPEMDAFVVAPGAHDDTLCVATLAHAFDTHVLRDASSAHLLVACTQGVAGDTWNDATRAAFVQLAMRMLRALEVVQPRWSDQLRRAIVAHAPTLTIALANALNGHDNDSRVFMSWVQRNAHAVHALVRCTVQQLARGHADRVCAAVTFLHDVLHADTTVAFAQEELARALDAHPITEDTASTALRVVSASRQTTCAALYVFARTVTAAPNASDAWVHHFVHTLDGVWSNADAMSDMHVASTATEVVHVLSKEVVFSRVLDAWATPAFFADAPMCARDVLCWMCNLLTRDNRRYATTLLLGAMRTWLQTHADDASHIVPVMLHALTHAGNASNDGVQAVLISVRAWQPHAVLRARRTCFAARVRHGPVDLPVSLLQSALELAVKTIVRESLHVPAVSTITALTLLQMLLALIPVPRAARYDLSTRTLDLRMRIVTELHKMRADGTHAGFVVPGCTARSTLTSYALTLAALRHVVPLASMDTLVPYMVAAFRAGNVSPHTFVVLHRFGMLRALYASEYMDAVRTNLHTQTCPLLSTQLVLVAADVTHSGVLPDHAAAFTRALDDALTRISVAHAVLVPFVGTGDAPADTTEVVWMQCALCMLLRCARANSACVAVTWPSTWMKPVHMRSFPEWKGAPPLSLHELAFNVVETRLRRTRACIREAPYAQAMWLAQAMRAIVTLSGASNDMLMCTRWVHVTSFLYAHVPVDQQRDIAHSVCVALMRVHDSTHVFRFFAHLSRVPACTTLVSDTRTFADAILRAFAPPTLDACIGVLTNNADDLAEPVLSDFVAQLVERAEGSVSAACAHAFMLRAMCCIEGEEWDAFCAMLNVASQLVRTRDAAVAFALASPPMHDMSNAPERARLALTHLWGLLFAHQVARYAFVRTEVHERVLALSGQAWPQDLPSGAAASTPVHKRQRRC